MCENFCSGIGCFVLRVLVAHLRVLSIILNRSAETENERITAFEFDYEDVKLAYSIFQKLHFRDCKRQNSSDREFFVQNFYYFVQTLKKWG